MSAVLYLARHGETEWNAVGKLQGRTDIPLNDIGRAQARALATRLSGSRIASVTTSDLTRAAETGAIVADAMGITARHVDPDLRERSFGIFEGLTRDECATRYPEEWRAWVDHTITPAGAELREVAVARMIRALGRVVAPSQGEVSLVISHGGAMRLLLIEWLGVPVAPIANGTVYRVEITKDGFAAALWE
jgi:probable phosphoglycerate mutase